MSEVRKFEQGFEAHTGIPGVLEVVLVNDRALLAAERAGHELAGLEAVHEISVQGEFQYAGVYVSPLNCRGYYYRYDQQKGLVSAPPSTISRTDQGTVEPAEEYNQDFLAYLVDTNRANTSRSA